MAEITAKMVNELRSRTGAGMMDCKKALVETNGDAEAAIEVLRKRGAAIAEKKASRTASQGLVASYIHSTKLGVMIELACESDFVAKNADFQAFAKDICMHIAAFNPLCISREEVPAELVEKERAIAMAQLAEDKKPDAIKQKIVEGKLNKYYASVCLLEQPFVKDDKFTVKELLTQKIATIGEKIEIKRFTRYQIG